LASCSQVNSFFQAHLDSELEAAEDRVLAAHLAACPACRAEVAAMEAFHRELVGACAMHRQQRTLRESVLAHLPEMEPALIHGSHPTDPGVAPVRNPLRFSAPLAACAALVFVVALIAVAIYPGTGPAQSGEAIGMVVFAEGPGLLQKRAGDSQSEYAELTSIVMPGDDLETPDYARAAIALAQDSSLKMNARSRATVGGNREVYVYAGQAYFDVGRDRDHFYVHTPTGEILVYGTSFLVDVAGDVTSVVVVKGDVLVSTPYGRTAITRGKQSILRRGQAPTAPEPAPADLQLAWALSMEPDASALALFAQMIGSLGRGVEALPAESVYAVRNLRDREVESIMLHWSHDGLTTGHCGYYVHVSDSNDNLLFLESVGGHVFNDPNQSSLTVLPLDGPISGVDVIHVRLIPDYTRGDKESDVRVHAVVR